MDNETLKEHLLNSINAIVACAAMLLTDAEVALPERQHTDIEKIFQSATHLHDFINEIKTADFGMLAHASSEVRTPLTAIQGFSEMMLNFPQMYGEALSASQQEKVKEIFDLVQELSQFVNKEIFHTIPRG